MIVLNLNPEAVHEQAGRRNAIVLSPKEFNELTGFIVVCPITNQKKNYPFEVNLSEERITFAGGNPITGVILTDQVKSLDWATSNVKVLKEHDQKDAEINEIINECLAKIATYLT